MEAITLAVQQKDKNDICANYRYYLLTERGIALVTAKNYVRLLGLFMKSNDLTIEAATNYYINLIGNTRYSSSFKHNIYFALKWYFQSQGIDWNMKKQKLERKVRKHIDYNRCHDLLNVFEKDGPIYTISYLMLTSGVRPSEALKLKIEDIDFQDKMITIRSTKTYADRIIPVGEKTIQVLKKWADDNNIKQGRLFVTTMRTLQNHYRKASEQLGFKVTPYNNRHSYATLFIENGGEILVLKTLYGHSSINTTLGYLTESKVTIRKGYDQFSPRF